jgi:hypothetical protein
MTLKGFESNFPNRLEESIFEMAKEERNKRKFDFIKDKDHTPESNLTYLEIIINYLY